MTALRSEAEAETLELRRRIRDLVALSTLPALWINCGPEHIAATLAEALVAMIGAEFIHVTVEAEAAQPAIEIVRTADRTAPDRLPAIRAALAAMPAAARSHRPLTIQNPIGPGIVRVATMPISFGSGAGIAAASREPGFPSETQRLLMSVAANQAALALQRGRAEADVRRFEALIECSSDFIGFASLDGRPEYINPAGLRLVGLDGLEEARRVHVLDFFLPEDRERVRDQIWPTVSREGRWSGEISFRHFRTGAAIPFFFDWFQIDDPLTGRPMNLCTVSRDLTGKKRTEAELRLLNETLEQRVAERTAELDRAYRRLEAESLQREQAQAALRQSQKMEAVGQVTGGVAHDFNIILTAIVNNLELVRVAPIEPAAERQIMGALQAARHGAGLVQQLLAFARKQPVQPRPVDLNELVGSLLVLIEHSCPEKVTLRIELAPDLRATRIDPGQMQTALLNLVVNARDAMTDGGSLTMTTRNVRVAADGAAQLPPGDYVCLAVADTGTGMSPEVTGRIFEPFFTTKGIGKGTGLGLSQVYGFVRQMGGDVVVESAVGRGTTMRLYLPITDELAEPLAAAAPEPAAPTRAATILLVEDDILVNVATVQTLESMGYRVFDAQDANGALVILAERSDIDLMITDIGLPGISGHQLAIEARRLLPQLRILFVTGYDRTSLAERIVADERVDYLGKPYQSHDLARAIDRLLAVPPTG
ncbi:MAG TPA: ATP-binding protein [Geminicoccaceae bacterium]|nr:ATP-binding protein [Geminicoccaceae bacterium]